MPQRLEQHLVRQKATHFARRWGDKACKEREESQTFINEFFAIFGIDRHGSDIRFEFTLENGSRIDALWPGVILIEITRSKGDLDSRAMAAKERYEALDENLKPEHILVNNFQNFHLFTRGEDGIVRLSRVFSLNELPQNVRLFDYFLDQPYTAVPREPTARIRYVVLVVAVLLSFLLGYVLSDGQPREYLSNPSPQHLSAKPLPQHTHDSFPDTTSTLEKNSQLR